jgi:hypothetical protein
MAFGGGQIDRVEGVRLSHTKARRFCLFARALGVGKAGEGHSSLRSNLCEFGSE